MFKIIEKIVTFLPPGSSHGAGRKRSRSQARETFTMQDMEAAMQGIAARLRPGLIDEIPGAYKDIDEVMENSRELVKIEHTLK